MIYALRELQTGHHKIGSSADEREARRKRLTAIRVKRARLLGRAVTLEFCVWAPWPGEAETELHRYLWREWQGDEWFSDSPRLQQVLSWLRANNYAAWHRDFRHHLADLPGNWHWKSRERVLKNWFATHPKDL